MFPLELLHSSQGQSDAGDKGGGGGGEKGVRRGRNRTDPAYRQRVRRERDKDSHESREKEKGLRSQGLDLK